MIRIVALIAPAALVLASCGGADRSPPLHTASRGQVTVSVEHGSIGGISLGDTASKVRHVFGRSAGGFGYRPVGERFTGPQALPGFGRPVRYRHFAFLVSGEIGVYSLMTTDRLARTERGVGVGDSLARVRSAYPGARCGRYDYGEGDSYRWCRLHVGAKSVFFGGDPVKSITITRLTG